MPLIGRPVAADKGEVATRILVVDDHPLTREALAALLTGHGFDVVGEASDGREAIDAARRLQPQLILLDLSMPEITAADEVKPIVLALPPSRCTPPLVERLREVLTSHPGSAEVHVKLVNGSRATLLRLSPLRVAPTTALMADLKALLGPSAVAG